jgi:ABC-type dipeptide/oligopeptide/nickel transport system ATPase component
VTDVAAIEIRGLRKRFGAVQAVSDMSFEVNAGRVTGFLGPNGAGKSTSDTSSLFITILAVVGITGEWRHRTITSSLLAAPDRLRFLAGKTIAFAAAGLVLSLVISIAVAVVGLIILTARDLPTPAAGELIEQVAPGLAVLAMLAWIGAAFAAGAALLIRRDLD